MTKNKASVWFTWIGSGVGYQQLHVMYILANHSIELNIFRMFYYYAKNILIIKSL